MSELPGSSPQVVVESLDSLDAAPQAVPAVEVSQPVVENADPPKPVRKSLMSRWWFKALMVWLVIVAVLGAAGGAVAWHAYSVGMELKSQVLAGREQAKVAYTAFKAQNLPEADKELRKVEDNLKQIRGTYEQLSYLQYIPVARDYYKDGTHGLNAADAGLRAGVKSLEAVSPYADVLGFTGEGTFTGGTAEDRLKLLLQTLEKVTPVLDQISVELKTVDDELAQIKTSRYPEEVKGIPVRGYLTQSQELSKGAYSAITEYRPIIEQLPAIAGAGGDRKKYLILFQNDNELRPTGGFLTAYATIFIEDGKVNPEKSDDIYEMDKKFGKKLPIPEALGRYLTTEKNWNLRDMNISPDFKTSMDQFLANYKTLKSEPQDLDGIVAVDTHVLTELLKVLGPVEVPGYGTFSAENDPKCDCPQIIHVLSEIITRPTPYIRENRKGIIGPLMRAILTKTYAAPRQQWPEVFAVGLKNIAGRHAQVYLFDEKAQAAVEKINAGGRLLADESAQDFLAIVDANLGGAKSNLFIDYTVKQTVSAPENGRITKTVEITYKNNRKADNCNLEAGLLCLNSTLRDWHRLYVPAGAELVEAQGFTQQPKTYEEAGFSVIDGFFILEPNSQAKVKITYTVPYTDTKTYRVKLWKQGGISPVPFTIDVNGDQNEVTMEHDMVFEGAF